MGVAGTAARVLLAEVEERVLAEARAWRGGEAELMPKADDFWEERLRVDGVGVGVGVGKTTSRSSDLDGDDGRSVAMLSLAVVYP